MVGNELITTSKEAEDCSVIQGMFDKLVFSFMMEIGKEVVIRYPMDHGFTRRRRGCAWFRRGVVMSEGITSVGLIKTF